MNPLVKSGNLLRPPSGIKDGSGSDSDSEDSGPPIVFAARGKLKRQDTFYDVNYDSVKVSTVPKTQEAWSYFMDMLKNEHRKFQMMVTTLRIERGKILKEFNAFSTMFNEAKEHIKAQFEVSLTDLKSVNCARLLKGEINKRSSSFIKATPVYRVSPPKVKQNSGSGKHSASKPSANSALFSVKESFGGNEDDLDEDEDSESGSSRSNRLPRPSVPMEFNVDEKTERRNKLRKKSHVPKFHVSTQTEQAPVTRGPSVGNRLDKFRKETVLAESLQYQTRPHALSQPFLGFIRKHEKIYAREIGLMRIALREFKGIYDHIRAQLDSLLSTASVSDATPALLQSLHQLQMMFSDGNWVFDPKFFMRKVNMNPLEDPIDVSAQTEVIVSYRNALHETEAELKQAEAAGDTERVETLKQVQEETINLLTDLSNRVKEKGGWHALLYTASGAVDLDMNIKPWNVEEQVLILQEKLRYMQVKSLEKATEHEKIVKKLQESLDRALSKDNYYNSFARSPKGKAYSPHSASHKSMHTNQSGRSMSLSSPISGRVTSGPQNNNIVDALTSATGAYSPVSHRHTLTNISKDNTAPGIVPKNLIPPAIDIAPPSSSSVGSVAAEPSVDELIQKVPSLDAYEVSPPKPNALPAEIESHVKQIVGTLGTLRTALEATQAQQEQQKQYIEQLEARLKHQTHMTDDLSTNTGTLLEGENSMMSHASNEIIGEYHQNLAHHNSFNNSFNSGNILGVNNRASMEVGIAHHLTAQQVATGSAGIRGTSARRGSALVMHRDSGGPQGGQIEYVPVGKVATSQTLRITVNNELRNHKHLLLRPASASAGSSASQKKSFANILSNTPVGGKGPVDKFRQLEIQHRREQALKMHAGAPLSPISHPRIGLFPAAAATPDVSLPVLHMRPPSPQRLDKMSDKAIIHELSTIMGSRSSSPQGPVSRPASPDFASASENQRPNKYAHVEPELSTDVLLKSLTDLCLKLQNSLSGEAETTVAGAGGNKLPLSEFAQQNGLQIGEAAIDHERQEEHRSQRRPESHHISTSHEQSPQRGALKRRPKTAGDVSGSVSRDSYEDIFGELIHVTSSSATHRHSDVSIYATTLQNRYVHHLDEAKKIEEAIKRLGRASDAEELEDQQDIARSHYVSRDAFRPKSAVPSVTQTLLGGSIVSHGLPPTGATTQRAFSASATRSIPALPSASRQHLRGETAVPFSKTKSKPKVHHVLVGTLPQVDLDAGSVTSVASQRLQEFSAELSNLSELELPAQGRHK